MITFRASFCIIFSNDHKGRPISPMQQLVIMSKAEKTEDEKHEEPSERDLEVNLRKAKFIDGTNKCIGEGGVGVEGVAIL